MKHRWCIARTFRHLSIGGDTMRIEVLFSVPGKDYLIYCFNYSITSSNEVEDLGKGAFPSPTSCSLMTKHFSYLTCNHRKKRRQRNLGRFTSLISQYPMQMVSRLPETEKTSPPLLQLSEVTFGYSWDKIILRNINFDVGLDSRIAIIGANGAGKSTLRVSF